MSLGGLTLSANAVLDTGNAAGGTINVGAIDGATFTLDLDSGMTAGATITVASADDVSLLEVVDAGGLVTFTGTVGAGTPGAVMMTLPV